MLVSFYKDAHLKQRHRSLPLTPDKEKMREYIVESRKAKNDKLDCKET
ncbi:hypothetical protein [Staphylococcus pseudintermedius]